MELSSRSPLSGSPFLNEDTQSEPPTREEIEYKSRKERTGFSRQLIGSDSGLIGDEVGGERQGDKNRAQHKNNSRAHRSDPGRRRRIAVAEEQEGHWN